MTDELERRWDDAMEEAWAGFRGRLADRLAGLDDGGTLIVQLPEEDDLLGATPYCQVLLDDGWLRVEAVSNEFLDAQHLLDGAQEQALIGLGFGEPADEQSPNFWIDLEQRESDRAAWLMVRAMREVYGVVHPIYLDADGLEPEPQAQDPGVSRLAPLAPQPPGDEPRVPEGVEELKEWLLALVSDQVGVETELDVDGDIPFFTDKAVFYVTVSTRAPRILIHSTLLMDVVDEERALVEVNLLNRAEFGLTFVLHDGQVAVRRELPMGAFVPSDFRMEVHRLTTDADRWITELQDRCGGRPVSEAEVSQPRDRRRRTAAEEPTDERFEQAMKVLRELESEERGSVDVATIVRIFHGDRYLLLQASRWALSSAARWGERRRKAEQEEGKASYAKGCRAQQRYYHQLRGRIRAALRSVVQAPAAKPERQAQLSLFAEDEATS
jgi:hypothetical protein